MEPYASDCLWIIILCFIVAFLLAFGVGANDVANSFGTSVGSKVLTLKQACILATIFEMLGALLLSKNVSETLRNELFETKLYDNNEKLILLVYLSALFGAAFWNILATFFKLPVSGTHSIIGAILGAHFVAKGFFGVGWGTLGGVVASWFVSPLVSGAISVVIYIAINRFILQKENPLENGLKSLPLFYGLTIAINLFSIVHNGPEYIHLNEIPLWGAFLIAIMFGISAAVFVWAVVIPIQRKNITEILLESSKEEETTSTSVTTGDETMDEIALGPIASGDVKGQRIGSVNTGFEEMTKSDETTIESGSHRKHVIPEGDDKPEVAYIFKYLQILTACFGSFVHGGNDVSNAIGPLIGCVLIWMDGRVQTGREQPFYLPIYGGIGISLGLIIWGRRVIKTMGEDLTKISPSSGFTIEVGAATTVLLASKLALPISTTHCKVGSVVLVGRVKGSKESVDWKLFGNIIVAWVLTVPVSAICSAAIMAIFFYSVPFNTQS